MGSRGENIVLYAFLGIVAVLIGYLIFSGGNDRYHWAENFHPGKENPYDLKVFYDLLDSASAGDTRKSKEAISGSLKDAGKSNYFFIGHYFNLDSLSSLQLIEFVKNGGNAFIATRGIPFFLNRQLGEYHTGTGEYFDLYGDTIYANFYNDDLIADSSYMVRYRRGAEFTGRDWIANYDSTDTDEDSVRTNLGYFQLGKYQYYNFFSLKIGKGYFYMHTNPILFTNYYLKTPEGFGYVNKVLGHLPGRSVVWDDYHHIYRNRGTGNGYEGPSPLKYILGEPALRTAWYVLIAGVALFLIFRSKREQRIIAVQPPVQNTSIEFAKSLGTLYYQAESGRYLVMEMMKLFDNYNRRRFGIHRKISDKNAAEEISRKTKVDSELIREILELEYKTVYNPSSKMKDIIPLYELLQSYYKQVAK